MSKILKLGTMLTVALVAFAVAFPAHALVTNADVAKNAGISYSKLSLKKKITSKDIKNGTIRTEDIKDDTIESGDIKDGTIKAEDIDTGTLTSVTLADGAVTSAKILDATILTGDISTGGVTTGNILDGTILTGDISADTILAADIATGAVATAEILDGTILTGDISTGGVATGNILDATILTGDISTGGVTTGNILDATILGGDLAANIAITTTGLANLDGGIAVDTSNFTVSGTNGDVVTAGDLAVNGDNITSDGTLDVNGTSGMSLNTTAGNITLDSVVGGAGNIVPGADSQDNIGTDATRWSTIYADTLNYSAGITDDNSANTTVALGDSNTLDTVNIIAKTDISSEHWSVTEPGVATFGTVYSGSDFDVSAAANLRIGQVTAQAVYVGASGHVIPFYVYGATEITGALTTGDITAYGATANNDLAINAKGTGDITLGDATDSDVAVPGALSATGNVTLGNAATDAIDLTGDVVIGHGAGNDVSVDSAAWDITAAGAATGLTGITSTGTVDFSGATLSFGAQNITTTGDISGTNVTAGTFKSGAGTGITDASVQADTNCVLQITGGIITGQTGCT